MFTFFADKNCVENGFIFWLVILWSIIFNNISGPYIFRSLVRNQCNFEPRLQTRSSENLLIAIASEIPRFSFKNPRFSLETPNFSLETSSSSLEIPDFHLRPQAYHRRPKNY